MNLKNLTLLFGLIAILYACTPKAVPAPQKPTEKPKIAETKPDVKLSPCKHWEGSPDREEARKAHVLYRDLLKLNKITDAFDLWEVAYELAPAADGQRYFHYMDGITIYKHFYDNETDPAKKEAYLKRVFEFYDEATRCYPENASLYKSLKAFDLYYNYPGVATDKEVFNLFKEVMDEEGKETPAHVINPFTALMQKLFANKEIEMPETQKYSKQVLDVVDFRVKEYKEKRNPKWKGEGWDIVEGYAPEVIAMFEGEKGFFDCAYYTQKYYKEYLASPNDCEVIETTYGRLKWGDCDKEQIERKTIAEKWIADCYEPPEPTQQGTVTQAYQAMEEGRYRESITLFEQAITETEDNTKKGNYNYIIARIYYQYLKKFSQSRQYARAASKNRPSWGKPYLLIGDLYASSGTRCGPGTGWDSQIVIWPAMDKWEKAKSVDPSVAKEANKNINRYKQYLPEVGEAFSRMLKDGDSFRVECWIQENTRVRVIK